jgi:dUTP pyrophosphatase
MESAAVCAIIALKCVIMAPGARLPVRKSDGAAGYDLHALHAADILPRGPPVQIRTGIAVEIPAGHYGRIAPRSSLAIEGITTMAGVIDSDYRGELVIILVNLHPTEIVHIAAGDRVAQLILERISMLPVMAVDALGETGRGDGGFGSTGK